LLAASLSLAFVPAGAGADLAAFNGGRAFDDLKHLVSFGPRPPGSDALARSREWMIAQLRKSGAQVEEDSFIGSTPLGNIPMTNVIAKFPGAKSQVIMLAGHYDTMRAEGFKFIGANDGGSSAAFLLEMARLLSGRRNPFTYWLVFFDGEEALQQWSNTDSLYGSRHLVQKLTADGDLGKIHAMILVDMIADSQLDIHREYYSTAWLQDIAFSNARRLGYGKYFLENPLAIEDDHIPFVKAGVSALDLIDLHYGPRDSAHPNGSYWHTAMDTLEHCSPLSMTIMGRVVVATLAELEKSSRLK
jgi:glutaminyl-peptide cyclotransferase